MTITTGHSLIEVALAYRAAGRSVLPIAPGSKAPGTLHPTTGEVKRIAWKRYTSQRPPEEQLHSWFSTSALMGIGIACGPVSGFQRDDVTYGLEVLDVDDAAILDQFVEAATWQGLGALLARLLHQRTPSTAGHFGYLCQEWAGNTKLAQRHDGVDEHGHPVVVTLIETRGEGGQVVVAPTPRGIHPAHPERGYELVRGAWDDLPIITPEERQALLTLARSFNTYVAPPQVHAFHGAPKPGSTGERPGDTLNETADRDWWQVLLERHGWTLVHQRGDIDYWQRPGKDGKAWSATLGACGSYFYVFSSNAAPFELGRAYSAFSAYTVLEHGGDFKAAAKALAPSRQRQNGHRRPPMDAPDAQGEPEVPQRERFRVDDKGVWYTPPVDKEGNQPPDVWVCAPLHIVAATRDVDNDKHGHLLEFHDRHGYPQQWAMPLELLEEQREYRKVLRRLGLLMNSAARDALQRYLDVCHAKERARCVDRVGWYGTAYVLPDITLGEAGEERLVLQTLDRNSEGYRQAGTLEGWQTEIAARCVGNSRLLVAVSTGFAAPLLEPLGEESGGLHFRGESSEGKTTALLAAATVWGEPGRLERWRATANGLEGVALAHNDNLLCLDELKELDAREAGGVSYMLSNGAGKRRGQPHGGTRPRLTWRLLFLSTGEHSLEQHIAEAGQRIQAGQEVRLVDVPADAGAGWGLFEELHGAATSKDFADQLREATTRNFGHAGRAFVAALSQDRMENVTHIQQLRDGFVVQHVPAGASGQVYRVAQRFGLIGAAGELATAAGITDWPEGAALTAAARCFNDWLQQRGGVGHAEEARALSQVRLFFERYGEARFKPWTLGDGETCERCHGSGRVEYTYKQGVCFDCGGAGKITDTTEPNRPIYDRAGFRRATEDGRTEFYVLPEVFHKEIAKGFEVQWLAQVLLAHALLYRASDGKPQYPRRLPGMGVKRVYHFKAEILGEAGGDDPD
jgi:uncharacterized protein (DUF927 family)